MRRDCKKIKCLGPAIFNIPETRDLPIGTKRRFAAASGRDSKAWLASCSAFAVALLLLGAMLWTLFEKNLVSTMTQQGWSRELYGISAALTKLRFGIGGAAVDQRLLATLMRSGLTSEPDPAPGVQYPDNLRDAKLLQSALLQAQTIDLPPPAPANAKGEYIDLIGFSGEDIGLGTYTYLAFRVFGVNIPALTYLYFVIVTASLLLYGIGHWRSVGAMAAVVAVMLALYAVVCADFVNFLGTSALFSNAGIDVKDPRFLGTIAAIPVLHLIVMWTRPRYRLGPLDYIVVAMQAAIFAFALQIRSPVIWAVLALSAFWLMVGALALRRGRSLRSLCDWRQSRSALMPDHRSRRSIVGAALGRRHSASGLPRAGRRAAAHVLAGPAVFAAARARLGQEIRRLGE